MSGVLYSATDRNLTEAAHLVAQHAIYPQFFDCQADDIQYRDGIEYQTHQGEHRLLPRDWCDSWLAMDRIIRVPAPTPMKYLEFTIQERFERATAAAHRNISITHFNIGSRNVSELYKLKAHYFVSGYFDQAANALVGKAHVCNVERILKGVQTGALKYYLKDNHKRQDFVTFGYEDLEQVGAVLMVADFRAGQPIYRFPDGLVLREIDEVKQSVREVSRTNVMLIGMIKDLIDRIPARPRVIKNSSANVVDLFGSSAEAGAQ